jgi:hypothetical protein
LPSPFIDKVKIVGNIIELNKPTATNVHIENSPFNKTVSITKPSAAIAKTARVLFALFLPIFTATMFRITKMKNIAAKFICAVMYHARQHRFR